MKKYLGPILLLLSLSAQASSTSGTLFLRAVVPVASSLEIEMGQDGPRAKLSTNTGKYRAQPKFEIKKDLKSYVVLVTHP